MLVRFTMSRRRASYVLVRRGLKICSGQNCEDVVYWLKFRCQHPIGPFVVDFRCVERRLAIELDGGVHADQRDHDAQREVVLAAAGYRVLRFPNEHVRDQRAEVLTLIEQLRVSSRSGTRQSQDAALACSSNSSFCYSLLRRPQIRTMPRQTKPLSRLRLAGYPLGGGWGEGWGCRTTIRARDQRRLTFGLTAPPPPPAYPAAAGSCARRRSGRWRVRGPRRPWRAAGRGSPGPSSCDRRGVPHDWLR